MNENIENRKLEFERYKFEQELRFERQKHAIDVKQRRQDTKAELPWWKTSIPWLAPSLSALVAVLTLIVANYQNERNRILAEETRTLELKEQRLSSERQGELKEKQLIQERETRIILQSTKDVSPQQARDNLYFFAELGYISKTTDEIGTLFKQGLTPRTGSKQQILKRYWCSSIPYVLKIADSYTVSVTENQSKCIFSIDGATENDNVYECGSNGFLFAPKHISENEITSLKQTGVCVFFVGVNVDSYISDTESVLRNENTNKSNNK